MQEQLVGEGVGEEVAGILVECLWVRREEVRGQLVRDSCAVSHSVLRDYDWKMKVTTLRATLALPQLSLILPPQLVLSSDKLGSVQQPLLSLDLDIAEDGERRLESVELSKEELAKLITSLEAANRVVLQLRT